MNRHHHYYRNQRSWHGGVHSGVWLIGLAILFLTGLWWPGILVLVGISMVLQWVFSKDSSPDVFEQAPQSPPAQVPPVAPASVAAPVTPPAPVSFTPAQQYHPVTALPSACPHCGGPVRANEVKWSGAQAAACAYCGSVLPLKKA